LLSKEKTRNGRCLLKGGNDENLGNLGDANSTAYASTLKNVRKRCRKPAYIIIAHNDWHNTNSLKHSLKMAKALKRKQ